MLWIQRICVGYALVTLLAAEAATAFPLGLGYSLTKERVEVSETPKEQERGTFKFDASYHTFSILDYSGLLCAGFQNAHRQMEAREKALDKAQYDSTIKPGDEVKYSWKAAEPVQGTACGIQLHRSTSEEKADIGGALASGKSGGNAVIEGWTAFGIVANKFESFPEVYWKLHLMVDVREVKISGIPGEDDLSHQVFGMPFDYELGRVFNIAGVGGFFAWGSVGYDMVLWILKSLVPAEFPTSFMRFGAGIGYQTPIEALQVKLGYKKNDTGFDARGVKETGYSLGVAYQM